MAGLRRVRGRERRGRLLRGLPGQPVLQVQRQVGQLVPDHLQVRRVGAVRRGASGAGHERGELHLRAPGCRQTGSDHEAVSAAIPGPRVSGLQPALVQHVLRVELVDRPRPRRDHLRRRPSAFRQETLCRSSDWRWQGQGSDMKKLLHFLPISNSSFENTLQI